MPRRVPLPPYRRTEASTAHPFPFQIATRALELLQGATFYPAFVDLAVGLYRDSSADSILLLREQFLANGMSEEDWILSINCMAKYIEYLPSPIHQAALVVSVSHWDWYVGKLGKFIHFARTYVISPPLSSAKERTLSSISLSPLEEQLSVLQAASGNKFSFAASHIQELKEMVLVRNLGVHSQWEVTSYYLKSTLSQGWSLGDVRDFEMSELLRWREGLYALINESSKHFAKMYVEAPDFDPYTAR